MVFVQSVRATRITISPLRLAVLGDLDLKSEDQTLDVFGDGSVRFDKQLGELRKANSFSLAELDVLKPKGDDAKRQLPQALQAIKSAITKLKAADRWNRLDDEVQDGTSNSLISRVLKKLGGARQNLQEASQISSSNFAEEIDGDIEVLRTKAQVRPEDLVFERFGDSRNRLVPVAYNPVFAKGFRCMLATARHTISKLTHGGNATAAASSAVLLACPDPTL
ncbi:MAG: hypothetical protein ABR607_01515 [Pyrinomonadaceae bacterium]